MLLHGGEATGEKRKMAAGRGGFSTGVQQRGEEEETGSFWCDGSAKKWEHEGVRATREGVTPERRK